MTVCLSVFSLTITKVLFFLLKNAFYVKLHSISGPYTLSQQSPHTIDLSRCLYLTHWLVQHEMCYLSVITVR